MSNKTGNKRSHLVHFTQSSSNKQTQSTHRKARLEPATDKGCAEACAEPFSALNILSGADTVTSSMKKAKQNKRKNKNVPLRINECIAVCTYW